MAARRPFRGEKGLGWEGGFRAPFLIRWPDHIPAGRVLNGIVSLEDVVPTIMAAAGVPDVKEQLLDGLSGRATSTSMSTSTATTSCPTWTGEADESPRHEFFYYGEHDLFAIRYNNWKVHFETKDDWFAGASLQPTVPQPVNLRVDPFEQHMDSPYYPIYAGEKLWTVMPAARDPAAARGHVQGLPSAPGATGLQPAEMVEAVIQAAAQRQGN